LSGRKIRGSHHPLSPVSILQIGEEATGRRRGRKESEMLVIKAVAISLEIYVQGHWVMG